MRAIALVCALLAGPAQAALEARDLDPNTPGHEAVYDTTQGITWLADAGAAVGSWNGVHSFAASLSVGGVTGWRIAQGTELYGLYNQWTAAGTAIYGSLGWLTGPVDRVDAGLESFLFTNAGIGIYWASRDGVLPQTPYVPWLEFERFRTDGGFCPGLDSCDYRGWVVRTGDVSPAAVASAVVSIPEPSTSAAIAIGLLLLALSRAKVRRPTE